MDATPSPACLDPSKHSNLEPFLPADPIVNVYSRHRHRHVTSNNENTIHVSIMSEHRSFLKSYFSKKHTDKKIQMMFERLFSLYLLYSVLEYDYVVLDLNKAIVSNSLSSPFKNCINHMRYRPSDVAVDIVAVFITVLVRGAYTSYV